MSIFIYEDHILQAQNLKKMIEDICSRQQIDYDFIKTTSRSDELLKEIPFASRIPIYFLDIEIKKDSHKGLSVAQEIRKIDAQGIIVFVTTHSELAPISYQYMVSALTFIDKGLPFEKRAQYMEQCLQHYAERNRSDEVCDDFVINHANAMVRVPFSSVEYVMTDGPHRLCLVTQKQVSYFYGTLKEIETLDERLIRCHQSYVVNKKQVYMLDASKSELVLRSGKTVPVSRRLMSKVKALMKDV